MERNEPKCNSWCWLDFQQQQPERIEFQLLEKKKTESIQIRESKTHFDGFLGIFIDSCSLWFEDFDIGTETEKQEENVLDA